MAWTTPRTWVANDVLTAAQLNTDVRDNMNETAVAKVTTAEDILVATGANALKRLAVGSNDDVLTVSGGAVAWVSGQRFESTVTAGSSSAEGFTFAAAFSTTPVVTATVVDTSPHNEVCCITARSTTATTAESFFSSTQGNVAAVKCIIAGEATV